MSVLRVASFNIRNGIALDGRHAWPFRRGATLAAIAQLNADIVGLQEAYACQLRYLARRLPNTTATGDGRSRRGRGEHTPLLVRAPEAIVESVTRHYDARPPRIATIAVVRLAGGAQVSVACTHLDERSKERRLASVSQLVDWLAGSDGPQIVLGDLNATANSDVLTRFADAGFARADTGPGGTENHFRGGTDGRTIDHILVRGGITVVAAGVRHARPNGTLPSDHWPVWAELAVPG